MKERSFNCNCNIYSPQFSFSETTRTKAQRTLSFSSREKKAKKRWILLLPAPSLSNASIISLPRMPIPLRAVITSARRQGRIIARTCKVGGEMRENEGHCQRVLRSTSLLYVQSNQIWEQHFLVFLVLLDFFFPQILPKQDSTWKNSTSSLRVTGATVPLAALT